MATVKEQFGSMVFDDRVMKACLDSKVYASLKKAIDEGKELDLTVAKAVAAAMKNWAVERGETHYTHRFQPSLLTEKCMTKDVTLFIRGEPFSAQSRLVFHRK